MGKWEQAQKIVDEMSLVISAKVNEDGDVIITFAPDDLLDRISIAIDEAVKSENSACAEVAKRHSEDKWGDVATAIMREIKSRY